MVSLAFVRIFTISEPHVFPDAPCYGGCRSWIELPDLPGHVTQTPVLDEITHREREAAIRALL